MSSQCREISLFSAKVLMLLLIVIAPLSALYIRLDPYRLIRTEAAFLPNPTGTPFGDSRNRNTMGPFNSSDLYLKNYLKQSTSGGGTPDYQAFIFGASYNQYFPAEEWRKVAGIPDSIGIIHFGSNSQTIMGMADRMEYLDRRGEKIRYALILIDPLTSLDRRPESISMRHTPLLPSPSPLRRTYPAIFHYQGFKSVMNIPFLASYLASLACDSTIKINGRTPMSPWKIEFDPATGEEYHVTIEALRKSDPKRLRTLLPIVDQTTLVRYPNTHAFTEYSEFHNPVAFLTDTTDIVRYSYGVGHYLQLGFPDSWASAVSRAEFDRRQRVEALHKIASYFRKHHTDYLILLPPAPTEGYYAEEETEVLYSIFGRDRVKDYSRDYMMLNHSDMISDPHHISRKAATIFLRRAYSDNQK